MSRLGETVLRRLSRDPKQSDYVNEHYELRHTDVDVYARDLDRWLPGLRPYVRGRRVLNIGCSEGMESLAIATMGAEVHGIDIRVDPVKRDQVLAMANGHKLSVSVMDGERTTFGDESFHAVVTCGSFEHFRDPQAILTEAMRVLRPGGRVFLTSGVWAHPWGAHMNFFTHVPWVQYLFSEKTIMAVRADYRDDGAKRYHEVEGGLNKVGVGSFCRMAREVGFHVDRLYLHPVKGLRPLTKAPLVRELFTQLIVARLIKPWQSNA